MRNSNLAIQLIGILLFFCLTAGCGSSVTSSSCGPQAAQIGVGEGYFTLLCGCKEAAGTLFSAPSLLSCTVSSGTTVFFHYLGGALPHQIVSTGQPSFVSSPVFRPNDAERIRVHAVQFSDSGTYSFQDLLQNGMVGQIIVQ